MADRGLFFKQKAFDFFNHVSREHVKEIIETPILLYKVAPTETQSNIYGESDSKKYYPPVRLYGLIRNSPEEVDLQEFGPDTTQVLSVAFNREALRLLNNTFPEIGDIFEWNSSYYEIDNVNESKFIAGNTDYDFSFVCTCHMTRQNIAYISEFRSEG